MSRSHSVQVGDYPHLHFRHIALPCPGLPDELAGLTIAHVTDLHLRPRPAPFGKALREWLADTKPSLIAFTGDFVEDKKDCRPALPFVRELLAGLSAPLGIYAVTGNHDGHHLPRLAKLHHVEFLRHGLRRLQIGKSELQVIGLVGHSPSDLDTAFLPRLGPKPSSTFRLVLSHYPELVHDCHPHGADLVLAGHTHGGQVCPLPGLRLMSHDRLPKRYAAGTHRIASTWLSVSNGAGFSSMRMRMFCPAEVSLITLTPPPSGRGPG